MIAKGLFYLLIHGESLCPPHPLNLPSESAGGRAGARLSAEAGSRSSPGEVSRRARRQILGRRFRRVGS